MKTILILGAGRSSSSLIHYLIGEAEINDWRITVGDFSEAAARYSIGQSTFAKAIQFDIHNEQDSSDAIAQADVVVSLLPATLHSKAARHCLRHQKHLLTASYVSDEMKSFHEEARSKNLLFLNECGLDPGIDHMSAMQVIDKIKDSGGKLVSFESFTGGLIAPETDPENPWRYKFTWNPRNVITAGQSTAKFLQDGKFKYIPYQQLFNRITPVQVLGYGDYEGYANRDSLKYIDTYNLPDVKTMIRGTLRHRGYCSAWNVFVQLGCCDDTYLIEHVPTLTHRDFINAFLNNDSIIPLEEKLANQVKVNLTGPEISKLKWSGFFDDTLIGMDKGTPAQILEHILNKKWILQPGDKDMIVMWHRFRYQEGNKKKEIQATCIAKGDDATDTAMSKTVGLPLAIATKLLLQNNIKQRGVVIPIEREFYDPILNELKLFGITLLEKQTDNAYLINQP
jgi:saccharopine dehydrogenase (NADP+, L-glutamate forming)